MNGLTSSDPVSTPRSSVGGGEEGIAFLVLSALAQASAALRLAFLPSLEPLHSRLMDTT